MVVFLCFFDKSAREIENRMNLDNGIKNIYAMFIDCSCLETSWLVGGPTESGANAARWDPLIQQTYYNGWKSVHGLKQTVDSAFRLAIDIFGPNSLRKNDVTLLRESKINERVQREC